MLSDKILVVLVFFQYFKNYANVPYMTKFENISIHDTKVRLNSPDMDYLHNYTICVYIPCQKLSLKLF